MGFMDSCITFLQGLYNLGAKELLLSETLPTALSQVKHQQEVANLLTLIFLHDHCFPLLSTWLIRASSSRRIASAMRHALR